MKVLLDSCAFIDLAINAATLTERAKVLFQSKDHETYLSVASIWELGLKKSLGKLDFDVAGAVQVLPKNSIKIVDINLPIALLVNELPYHHRDPFDRIIVATAKTHEMNIMTSDSIFDSYGVNTINSRVR